jgi:hypothetical protein
MRALRSFPKQYKLVNETVAEVRFYYASSREEEDLETQNALDEGVISTDYRHYDFFVTLKDGRGFGFSAYTPEYIRDYLTQERIISFVDSGIVIVSDISVDALLAALEECLEREYLYGLEAFGYRSNNWGDIEKRFRVDLGSRLLDVRVSFLKKWTVYRRKDSRNGTRKRFRNGLSKVTGSLAAVRGRVSGQGE